jgi:hypothetical protein
MSKGRFSFTPIILPTSSFRHPAGRLFKQVIIQFDYAVAKGEAFFLDGFGNLAHIRLFMMSDV